MDKKKAKDLATHIIEYQSARHNLKEKVDNYELRKENSIREVSEAIQEYNFPNEEHQTIIPHLPDSIKEQVLLSFVGKTLVLLDWHKYESNHVFGKVDPTFWEMYPKVISVRTEPFGKKEGSVVYMLTLSWKGKEFDYMCGLFSRLLELKIKE